MCEEEMLAIAVQPMDPHALDRVSSVERHTIQIQGERSWQPVTQSEGFNNGFVLRPCKRNIVILERLLEALLCNVIEEEFVKQRFVWWD